MATVTMTTGPRVAGGHVAAWVGVGGVGLGERHGPMAPGRVRLTDSATRRPVLRGGPARHAAPRFVALLDVVQIGQVATQWSDRDAVAAGSVARMGRDGTPVTPPISLESSHDRWSPVATSESWNGGLDSCNGLGYRFANIGCRQAAVKRGCR